MKLLQKGLWLALVAWIAIMPTTALAAVPTDTQKSGLPYEEALRIAISSNDMLRKINNEIDAAKNQRNTLSSNFPPEATTSAPYLSTMAQSSSDLETLIKNKHLEYDSTLDAITLELQNIFFSVKLHEDNMRINDRKISHLRESLSIEMQKRHYGVASEFSVKKMQNDLDKMIKEQLVLEKEVQKHYFALNKLLGQANVKYTKIRPITLEYKLVDAQDSERKIGIALSNSAVINYKKAYIASLELKKQLYPLYSEAAWITGAPAPEKPALLSDDISIANDELIVQKRNLEMQIRNLYNNLKSLEATVKAQETQQRLLKERIRIAEVQLKAGMITKPDVEEAKLQLETLTHAIESLKGQHSLLKLQFDNPHLIQ